MSSMGAVTPGADGGDGDDGDEEGGKGDKKQKNTYRHLIKGIPGAYTFKIHTMWSLCSDAITSILQENIRQRRMTIYKR